MSGEKTGPWQPGQQSWVGSKHNRELFGGSHCRFPWKKLPRNSLPDKLLGKLQRFQSFSLMVLMSVVSLLPALYRSKIQLLCLSSRVQNCACVCFEKNEGPRKGHCGYSITCSAIQGENREYAEAGAGRELKANPAVSQQLYSQV